MDKTLTNYELKEAIDYSGMMIYGSTKGSARYKLHKVHLEKLLQVQYERAKQGLKESNHA